MPLGTWLAGGISPEIRRNVQATNGPLHAMVTVTHRSCRNLPANQPGSSGLLGSRTIKEID